MKIIKGHKQKNKFRKYRISILGFTLLFVLIVAFFAGALTHKKGYMNVGLSEIRETNVKIPINYFYSLFENIEELNLDIEHLDYQKLAFTRKQALSYGYLADELKEYVPISMTYQGQQIKAKARIKGTLPDHWSDDKKWSFRIKINDEGTVEDMKRFSIQQPKTRGYLKEWFYSTLNQSQGILAARYYFTHLILNGTDYGIYAIEEHFDKRLLESQGRREGPIIKFGTNEYAYYDNRIETFTNLEIHKEEQPLFQQAANLLELFRVGDLDVNDVFDIDVLAKYFAISDIVFAMHATAAHNIRFYYNPISSKLEPIAYDAEILEHEALMLKGVVGQNKYNSDELKFRESSENSSLYFHYLIFNDPVFFRKYISYLEDFTDSYFLDAFFEEYKAELNKNQTILHRSFPHINFKKNIFYERQKQIKKLLEDAPNIIAYKPVISNKNIIVSIENESGFPIVGVSLNYKNSIFKIDSLQTIEARLGGKDNSIFYQKFIIPSDIIIDSIKTEELTLRYKILGAKKIHSTNLQFYAPVSTYDSSTDIHRMNANFKEFDWIDYDEEKKEIYLKNGNWTLDRVLVIPSGTKVLGSAPLKIDLINGAHILSNSPISLNGTKNDFINITSSDSTSAGLSVINARKNSEIKYVEFDNLSNPKIGDWSLSGAITFYQSPVDFSNCNFLSNREGDHYVNIFRSSFELNNCNFRNSNADALDLDFSDGQIQQCNFFSIGNDAIDASGSSITINNSVIDGVLDKAISSGENSKIKVDNLHILNSEIAFAAKDNSTLNINNSIITASTIGFTAFQKKPEFGPAKIYVNNTKLSDIDMKYLIEKNSILSINNVSMTSKQKNIKELMYGIKYGKSSK